MDTDAWLAVLHHIGVFALLGVLTAEWAIVRPGITAAQVGFVSRIDRFYGLAALWVIVVGICRVAFGVAPASFYLENPTFWVKMAGIAAIGILSAGPTRRYPQWRRAAADGGAEPEGVEIDAARRAIHLQLAVFPMIPIAAALMARGIGN
ncbi:MAG: DUF2214 family protein [Acidimicrobiales bacterium]